MTTNGLAPSRPSSRNWRAIGCFDTGDVEEHAGIALRGHHVLVTGAHLSVVLVGHREIAVVSASTLEKNEWYFSGELASRRMRATRALILSLIQAHGKPCTCQAGQTGGTQEMTPTGVRQTGA